MHVGVCENGGDVYRVPRSAHPAALKLIPNTTGIGDGESPPAAEAGSLQWSRIGTNGTCGLPGCVQVSPGFAGSVGRVQGSDLRKAASLARFRATPTAVPSP